MGSIVDAAKANRYNAVREAARTLLRIANQTNDGMHDNEIEDAAGVLIAADLFVDTAELAEGPAPVDPGAPDGVVPGLRIVR